MQRGVEGLSVANIIPDIISKLNSRVPDLIKISTQGAPEPVCVENMQGVLVGGNRKFLDLLQIPVTLEEINGKPLYKLWPNRVMLGLSLEAATVRRNREIFSRRTVLPLPDGPFPRSITIRPIFDLYDRVAGSFTFLNPPQQEAIDSNIDQMSGLLNRDAFDHTVDDLSNEENSFAVLIADHDGFKLINDTEGHFGGDQTIEEVGALIRHSFRMGDIKARIGGDEIAVIARGVGLSEGREMVKRLNDNVKDCNKLCLHSRLQLSVGLAIAKNGPDIYRALKLADQRMYTSKRAKKEVRAQLLAA